MIRTRSAPSPTGPCTIGSLYQAILTYLFAKRHKGKYILRIEDTDQKRLVKGSEKHLIESLQWLGITPDEGPLQGGTKGPYRQSERKGLYKKYALELIKQGKAYYAFDTPEELQTMRLQARAQGVLSPKYNFIVRMKMKNSLTLSKEEVEKRLAEGQSHVIRMLIQPSAIIKAKDQIRGWIQVKSNTLDDKVLLKADGMATYHLASVVDDYLMKISHIIRGEEWLPSLPYHILLYQYLGWAIPKFFHTPLLLNAKGKGKLSKRTAQKENTLILPISWQDPITQQTIPGFREEGYLPEALLNFIALLGWHPSGNREFFTKDELIQNFDPSRIGKAGARFDIKKAAWFNQKYLEKKPENILAEKYLLPMLQKKNITCTLERATLITKFVRKGITFPKELLQNSQYLFEAPNLTAIKHEDWSTHIHNFLKNLLATIAKLQDFNMIDLGKIIEKNLSLHKVKKSEAMQFVRLAITGKKKGLPITELLYMLGKEETIKRFTKTLELL